jgi:hypothetical protein
MFTDVSKDPVSLLSSGPSSVRSMHDPEEGR